jgi:hypothetical protein
VGLGGIGIVVPGLPTTVFFIVAASCFSRSSPRFEQWVLDLPKIGQMVRDHRDGLGMSRKVKRMAIGMMWLFAGGSAIYLMTKHVAVGTVVGLSAVVGTYWILRRVPLREQVLAQRAASGAAG